MSYIQRLSNVLTDFEYVMPSIKHTHIQIHVYYTDYVDIRKTI